MARRTKTVVIDAPGRDQGRHYLITEMSAADAEDWAARAFAALARSGVEVPENIADAGLAGIAALGMKALAGADFDDVRLLMQRMMDCVEFIPDPAHAAATKRKLWADDVEEVATRLLLRKETVELHLGFSIAGGASTATDRQPRTTVANT